MSRKGRFSKNKNKTRLGDWMDTRLKWANSISSLIVESVGQKKTMLPTGERDITDMHHCPRAGVHLTIFLPKAVKSREKPLAVVFIQIFSFPLTRKCPVLVEVLM